MKSSKKTYEDLVDYILNIDKIICEAAKTEKEKMTLLKEACYSDSGLMTQMKQLFLDITILRWEQFDYYCMLVNTTNMARVVEKVITGIMMEEAVDNL